MGVDREAIPVPGFLWVFTGESNSYGAFLGVDRDAVPGFLWVLTGESNSHRASLGVDQEAITVPGFLWTLIGGLVPYFPVIQDRIRDFPRYTA